MKRLLKLSNYTKEELLNLPFEEKDKLIENNQYLDIFINDPDTNVRISVAYQKYRLDILINDPEYRVREEVAYRGYGLDILINDSNFWVRRAVAERGYKLDVLINDPNYHVRRAAKEYCENHPEKPECQKILELYNL